MPKPWFEHFTLQPTCQQGPWVGAQDQASGLWDPGHAFRATASFHSKLRHSVPACPPCSITRRSCHLRGRSPTQRRAASGVNREEPWGENKAVGTWDDMGSRDCCESPPSILPSHVTLPHWGGEPPNPAWIHRPFAYSFLRVRSILFGCAPCSMQDLSSTTRGQTCALAKPFPLESFPFE